MSKPPTLNELLNTEEQLEKLILDGHRNIQESAHYVEELTRAVRLQETLLRLLRDRIGILEAEEHKPC